MGQLTLAPVSDCRSADVAVRHDRWSSAAVVWSALCETLASTRDAGVQIVSACPRQCFAGLKGAIALLAPWHDDSCLVGEDHGLDAVSQSEFHQDPAHVRLDGLFAEV